MYQTWLEIQKAYEQVKEAKKKGMSAKVKGDGFIVYSMGENNPVIRIDMNLKEIGNR